MSKAITKTRKDESAKQGRFQLLAEEVLMPSCSRPISRFRPFVFSWSLRHVATVSLFRGFVVTR